MKCCHRCNLVPRRKHLWDKPENDIWSCSDWNCDGYKYWWTFKHWNYLNRAGKRYEARGYPK